MTKKNKQDIEKLQKLAMNNLANILPDKINPEMATLLSNIFKLGIQTGIEIIERGENAHRKT